MEIKPISEVIAYLNGKRTNGRTVSLPELLNSIGGIPSLDKYVAQVITAPHIHQGPNRPVEFIAVATQEITENKLAYHNYCEEAVKKVEGSRVCDARHALNIISEFDGLAEYVHGHTIGMVMSGIKFPADSLGTCFYITSEKLPSVDAYAIRLHGVKEHQVIAPDVLVLAKA